MAAVVYVLGVFVPTGLVNVLMNEALDAAGELRLNEASAAWSRYSGRWKAWNTFRAVFSAAALALVGAALVVWGGEA